MVTMQVSGIHSAPPSSFSSPSTSSPSHPAVGRGHASGHAHDLPDTVLLRPGARLHHLLLTRTRALRLRSRREEGTPHHSWEARWQKLACRRSGASLRNSVRADLVNKLRRACRDRLCGIAAAPSDRSMDRSGGRVSDEVSEVEMDPEPIPQSNIGRQSFCCAPLVRAFNIGSARTRVRRLRARSAAAMGVCIALDSLDSVRSRFESPRGVGHNRHTRPSVQQCSGKNVLWPAYSRSRMVLPSQIP